MKLAAKATAIAETTKGKFIFKNGRIHIDGERLPSVLSERLVQFVDNQLDTDALENFWDNLKENPSESSKADLFLFLEKNHIPLTEDGCFIGYKKVRDDFKDKHTGTIDNTPGKVVSMDRSKVNANRNVHCSTGLHVADYTYAANGPMGNGRLLKVKVNPKDVVSVPTDYNARKMRVCRYQSLEEYAEKQEIPDQLVVEPEATKKVRNRVTKGKFKPLILKADKEGRLRIPGRAIRAIGAGVGATVVAIVNNVRSRHIRVSFKMVNQKVLEKSHATREYKWATTTVYVFPHLSCPRLRSTGMRNTVFV